MLRVAQPTEWGSELEPFSSTDDTSLPFAGPHVSIHAQILREFPLDWFYDLRKHVPSNGTEVKSGLVSRIYFGLPTHQRSFIDRTLRNARINIVDPRPYTRNVNEALAGILPRGQTNSFLQRLEQARRNLIMEQMLKDSPARRLRVMHRWWQLQSGVVLPGLEGIGIPYLIDETELPEERPVTKRDLLPFDRKHKDPVSVLSSHLSKSGSVFAQALTIQEGLLETGGSPFAGQFHLVRALAEAHAFDRGDAQAIRWVTNQRNETLQRLTTFGFCATVPAKLPEVDSRQSVAVQAADWAAGIVRETWEKGTLVDVVHLFSHVTYNGRRISQEDAAEIDGLLPRVVN